MNEKFWNKYFKIYDSLNELIPYKELLNKMVQSADIKKGDLILDAGSGTGNLSVKIDDLGAKIIAFDYSKEGMNIHKSKYSHSTKFIIGDLKKKLPFGDETFDKILSNNVLYTFTKNEREFIWREFFRILKHGGTIVVSNIIEGFKPFEIYKNHIILYKTKEGLLKTIYKIFKLIIPTSKIFYYNLKIKRADRDREYDFLKHGEQKEEMEIAGFRAVSEDVYTYSNQAILNRGIK